jgi:VIT1/CCC1 family predicted Fe2+/Mn2+ transporter
MLAAVSSFVAFALGAVVPVLPYLFGATQLWPGVLLTLLALFACGALVTQVTIRPWWYGGLRMTVLGGGAAAVTYAVGGLVGAAGLG